MPKETAAEWILTLVTTPDRATSTVGDLLEEGSGRGACWFWSSVLRTAASHVWRDLCSARGRMIRLAFSGVLEWWAVSWGLGTVVILEWVQNWPYPYGPNGMYIPPWGFYGLLIKPYPYVQNDLVIFCVGGLFVMAGALVFRLRAQRRSQADLRFHAA